MVIAIDGPAGAGKSTVARELALKLRYTYLDTGAMYRSVALAMLRTGHPAADVARAAAIELEGGRVLFAGEDVTEAIRAPEVSERASEIAADPEVRAALVEQQRALLEDGDWVAEGRDIGTVVRPDAELKIFLTASEQERAQRRAREHGGDPTAVLAEQRERDARDAGRAHSPLRAAEDAIELDTTGMAIDEVVGRIVELGADRA